MTDLHFFLCSEPFPTILFVHNEHKEQNVHKEQKMEHLGTKK